MALVPAGMANGAGAGLNQFPPVVVYPFAEPIPLQTYPKEIAVQVIPPYFPGFAEPARKSYQYQMNVEVDVDVVGPTSAGTKVRFQFRDAPEGGTPAPFAPGSDSSTFIWFIPEPGNTATIQSIDYGFAVPATEAKWLYVTLIRAAGDTGNYAILPQTVLTLQRVR